MALLIPFNSSGFARINCSLARKSASLPAWNVKPVAESMIFSGSAPRFAAITGGQPEILYQVHGESLHRLIGPDFLYQL